MTNVLIIDADRSIRSSLKERLEYEGYRLEVAESKEQAAQKLNAHSFDIVLCERKLPDGSGCELLQQAHTAFIMLSAEKGVETAVECMRLGAYDYLPKPIDFNKLLLSMRSALSKHENHATPQEDPMEPTQERTVKKNLDLHHGGFVAEQIIGDSQAIGIVKRLIGKVAPSDARVLITGPNGTGKELVARALHHQSNRLCGPFVEVNCAAIPSELIESELFGHEKGAFTSAIKQRKGKFEQADQGTLFLDEIGDMSLSAQAKVLRALQESKITRVGSDRDIDVNVRVVAATNKNLQLEIANGLFREDLYHRLSVIVIRIPPLKERLEDIPQLVVHFVERISKEYGVEPKVLEPDALAALSGMAWTGNIRELRNVIERLMILSGKSITLEDVNMYALGV